MKVYNSKIPDYKLKDFQTILGKSKGHFLRNPQQIRNSEQYLVDYEIDTIEGIELFQKLWRRCNLDIVEKTKPKTIFQKICNFLTK